MQRSSKSLNCSLSRGPKLLANFVGIARLDIFDAHRYDLPVVASPASRSFAFFANNRTFVGPFFLCVLRWRVRGFTVATRTFTLSYVVRTTLGVGAGVGAIVAAGAAVISAVIAVETARATVVSARSRTVSSVISVELARSRIVAVELARAAVISVEFARSTVISPVAFPARAAVIAVETARTRIVAAVAFPARAAVVAVKLARTRIVSARSRTVSSVVAVKLAGARIVTAWATWPVATRSAIKFGFFVAGHGTLTLSPRTQHGVPRSTTKSCRRTASRRRRPVTCETSFCRACSSAG